MMFLLHEGDYNSSARLMAQATRRSAAAQPAGAAQTGRPLPAAQSFFSGITSFRVPSLVMIRISTASPCQATATVIAHRQMQSTSGPWGGSNGEASLAVTHSA